MLLIYFICIWDCRGRDRAGVGFTTTCAISVYHHHRCDFEFHLVEVNSIQHYVTKFVIVSDLRGTPASSCNKTYIYDITELLLKVGLNTINLILHIFCCRTKQKNKH